MALTLLSHRQGIRDGEAAFVITGDFWPAFLYPHAKGNPKEAEVGIFKSALLVKVPIFFPIGLHLPLINGVH